MSKETSVSKGHRPFESFEEFSGARVSEARNLEWAGDAFKTSAKKMTSEGVEEIRDSVNEVLRLFSRMASETEEGEPEGMRVEAIAFGKIHGKEPDGVVSVNVQGFDTKSISADQWRTLADDFTFVSDIGADPDRLLDELDRELLGDSGDLFMRLRIRTVPVVDGVKSLD